MNESLKQHTRIFTLASRWCPTIEQGKEAPAYPSTRETAGLTFIMWPYEEALCGWVECQVVIVTLELGVVDGSKITV